MDDSFYFNAWLKNAHNISYGDDSYDSKSSDQQLLDVGRYLMSMTDDAGIDEIVDCLKDSPIYGPLSYSRNDIIECYLAYLFTVRCSLEKRALYGKGILSLEEDIKGYIMQVIKDNQGLYETEIEASSLVENDVSMFIDDTSSLVTTPVKYSVIEECILCSEKLKRIDHLQQQLTVRNAEEQETVSKLKESFHYQSNSTVNAEVESIELQAQLREKDKRLQEAEKKVVRLETELMAFNGLKIEVADLKDELEVLRPYPDKLDSSEARNEKLKAKLEDLKDVKSQLSVEYSKHSETFAALTELQQEAELLRKLKPQLEEYRSQQAELNITLSELRLRLSDKEEETARFQQINDSLSGGQQGSHLQTQHLLEELRAKEEQLREVERTGGIGSGMSEMNSDIMQELARLKRENADLRDKLESSALDSLERLRKDLSDQQVVVGSLQKKLMTTKDALQSALSTIDALRADLLSKENELSVLTERFEETCAMYEADTTSLTRRHALNTEYLINVHNNDVHQMTVSHDIEVRDLAQRLEETASKLNDTHAALSDLKTRAADMATNIVRMESELQTAASEQERIISESESTRATMQSNFEQLIAEQTSMAEDLKQQMLNDHQEQVDQMTHAHREQLESLMNADRERLEKITAAHSEQVAGLTADLEEEGNKRRKLDRVKKFFEAEVQRLKNQVQVACGAAGAGGGSGQDLDSAVKELRTMQLQLDEAHAEISFLRSHAHILGASENSSVQNELEAQSGAPIASSSLKGPMRIVRGRTSSSSSAAAQSDERDLSFHGLKQHNPVATVSASASGAQQSVGIGYTGFLEQAELSDKRIDMLVREKREMLSKSLEENKEKMELSQKLLVVEREVVVLRDSLRKVTLEKDRVERKLLKSEECAGQRVNDENAVNRIVM